MLFCRCDSSAQVRRRGQRLTVVECALLFYRALITTPVWFQYFEDTHLGSILTSSCTGDLRDMAADMAAAPMEKFLVSCMSSGNRTGVFCVLYKPPEAMSHEMP